MRIGPAGLAALALPLLIIGGVVIRHSIVIGGLLIMLGILTTCFLLVARRNQ